MRKRKEQDNQVRVAISVTSTVTVQTFHSIQHIQSASLFARLGATMEATYDGKRTEALVGEHRAYVTASIFTSVAFMEAVINEFFASVADDHIVNDLQKQIDTEKVSLITSIWNETIFPKKHSWSTLEKYQLALRLLDRTALEEGTNPYQDARLAISLRNVLIHPKPEWVVVLSDNPDVELTTQTLENNLRSKFPLNPMYEGVATEFFPNRCLSHGCAAWAVQSCLALADGFYGRIDITPHYDHIRERLVTE